MIINYPGNKHLLSKKIINYIPKEFDKYVEPFSGSFFVYFSLPYDKTINTKVIYNDSNYNLVKIFKYIKHNGVEDILKLNINENTFNEILLKSEKNELDYLSLLLCSDSIVDFKYKNSKYLEWLNINIYSYYPHIKNIDKFENYAYDISMLKHDSKNTFFYLDPPYVNKEHFYGIKTIDHNSMYNLLKNIKGKFLLSYSYFDDLFDLYKDFEIINIYNGYQKEYIVKNF